MLTSLPESPDCSLTPTQIVQRKYLSSSSTHSDASMLDLLCTTTRCLSSNSVADDGRRPTAASRSLKRVWSTLQMTLQMTAVLGVVPWEEFRWHCQDADDRGAWSRSTGFAPRPACWSWTCLPRLGVSGHKFFTITESFFQDIAVVFQNWEREYITSCPYLSSSKLIK